MRRLISIALTALMILSLFTVGAFTTTASAADAAAGSVESGYTPTGTPISTAEEFANMDPTGNYYLAADISIDSIYGVAYTASGDVEYDETGGIVVDTIFEGTLDGNGKTITVSVPMFADVLDATFKNMVIKGAINFRSDTGKNIDWHCGTVAMEGRNITIDNVANYATVMGYETAKTVVSEHPTTFEPIYRYDSVYSGGLLGSVYGDLTVTNCENYGTVTALVAGGIVGSLKKVPKAEEDDENFTDHELETVAVFENCHNYATISDADCHDLEYTTDEGKAGKKTGLAAGIVSYLVAYKTDFINCSNTADIFLTVSKGGRAGGISGYVLRSDANGNDNTITYLNCINEGTVIGWDQIGGIGGWTYGHIKAIGCVNNGAVTSRNNYAGGIIGRPGGGSYPNAVCDVVFENCVNNGLVTGHRQYASGIAGYSQDRTTINYCINTGDIYAEGVTATSDNNSHGHPIISAGMIANTSQTIEMYYCVNTGNIVSNYRSAGLVGSAGAGTINSVTFTGGYNTFFGCLSAGDVIAFNEKHQYTTDQDGNDDGTCDDVVYNYCLPSYDTKLEDGTKGSDGICDSCGGTVDVDFHRHYFSNYCSAGILGYSYGSGNNQAPRIIGCGVTANISVSSYGAACAFMGYANTAYAMIQGNYFIGTLDGPEENTQIHQVTKHANYKLEYATCWIDRCDSEKYVKNNYYLESIKDSGCMLMQNNGAEIDFASHDCYVTLDDVTSGKLCYLVNDDAYSFLNMPALLQRIGVDQYPTSPYYYLNDDNSVNYTYWVNEDGSGGYKNEEYIPEESETETESDDVTTEPEDDVTTEPEDDVTTEPGGDVSTADQGGSDTEPSGGGCGSVVGASVALVALALLAPAGIMLKKRDEE